MTRLVLGGGVFERRIRREDRPLLGPLPARQRIEDPSVPAVLPLPASVLLPHPTRRFSAQGTERLGLGSDGRAPTKAARVSRGLREGVGVKDGPIPRWGSQGGGWGWAAVPFFLNPLGQLRIAAVAGCPTLF